MRQDASLQSLGSSSSFDEPEPCVVNYADTHGAISAPTKTPPDTWLLRSGAPTDVLSFTRSEMFDELLRTRDDERQRIGQELHDSAGQLLLSLQLTVACVGESQEGLAKEALLGEIKDTARLIEQEIRSLAFLNHPVDPPANGLAPAIEALVMGFGKRSSCRVSFDTVGDLQVKDPSIAMALLRITQEALVNVHRHAHASSVAVRLERSRDRLDLTIEDDGVGFPSPAQLQARGGVGVKGMSFRVERLGGRCQVVKLKKGSRITASVPMS